MVDVLRYETSTGPSYRTVSAGEGDQIVAAHEAEVARRRWLRWACSRSSSSRSRPLGWSRTPRSSVQSRPGSSSPARRLRRRRRRVPDLVDERIRRERATSQVDVAVHAASP